MFNAVNAGENPERENMAATALPEIEVTRDRRLRRTVPSDGRPQKVFGAPGQILKRGENLVQRMHTHFGATEPLCSTIRTVQRGIKIELGVG